MDRDVKFWCKLPPDFICANCAALPKNKQKICGYLFSESIYKKQKKGRDRTLKMWAGRFSKPADTRMNDFHSSIRFDFRMYEQDIKGSMAHVQMLAAQKIISNEDAQQITDGLAGIYEDLKTGSLLFDPDAEDIHMFIEQELTARIGDAGKRLHTARSRNDQVALDLRVYLRDEMQQVHQLLCDILTELCEQAKMHLTTVMPGYTHLQRAQPITFGHHLMAYANMFSRDILRIQDACKRMNAECPLGSGALAGTTHPIDRSYTANLLKFAAPCSNSLDGVSDRDFVIELCSALATVMMHLSRFCEEIVFWCSWEFKFIELDDSFATGSSIMPQKKNPDVAELIRGKTGRVYGDLMTLLTMMKGLPLAYNKDMQEDKEAIFDAVDTVKLCLNTFIPMLQTMTVCKENMRAAAAKGFINATDCADYLTKKGVPFRDAYKCTGMLVAECIEKNLTLETLPFAVYQAANPAFEADIFEAIRLENCLKDRVSIGGPAPESVQTQIKQMQTFLASVNL